MSFEDRLNKVISEATPQDPSQAQRFPARRQAQPAQQGQKPNDFAAVRKSIRRPMVALDAAVHQIDQFLNTTQQDPSQLASTVTQIEKAFNAMLQPMSAVRDGVTKLRQAADTLEQSGFEYVGQKQEPEAPAAAGQSQQPTKQGGNIENDADQDRFLNHVATDVEMSNRQEDKMYAAKQGWEAYKKSGGKMNRGEFFRALVQKLRLPDEAEKKPALPDAAGSKNYGRTGRRTGELQYHPTRTAQIESSVQRRKLVEGWNKNYSLGQLEQGPSDDDRLVNKAVTAIEIVNNLQDKKSAFRDGWLEYQNAGGKMNHSEFVKAVITKLKMSQAQPPVESSIQRRKTITEGDKICSDCGGEATGHCVHCGKSFCRTCSDKDTCWKDFHKGSF